MSRCVVNVSTGDHYGKGGRRLAAALEGTDASFMSWDYIPDHWPSHQQKPYAFKAYALDEAARAAGFTQLLWCDACIVPVRSLDPIWDHAAEHGVWMSRNGYTNYEWTAESAYEWLWMLREDSLEAKREANKKVPHVVATAFAIDLTHRTGRLFLNLYYAAARDTQLFCGPWINDYRAEPKPWAGERTGYCGPADVRGHRHDQTAASVIAWHLGVPLTDPPKFFSYPPGDESTILIADGNY